MPSCPVIFKKVDQNVIRVMAGLVSALGIAFITAPQLSILILLLYDFLVRVVGYEKISPLFYLAKSISKLLKLKKDEIDAGPKEFALKIGFLFVLISFIMFLSDETTAAVLVVAILTICALLEAGFNYCIGCKMYMILKKLRKYVS
jgi:hypothetical protein